MDSLKEKDNPAPNPAKRPRIEVDEELMRQMIAGQAPLDSEVVRRIPEPEEEDTNALEENTSETVSGASASTFIRKGRKRMRTRRCILYRAGLPIWRF